jgi:hypothetical protein
VNQLKAELEAQKQRQTELEDKINQLEARQKLRERSLKEKIDQVAAQKPAAGETQKEEFTIPDILKWASKVGLYGDFRYRYEYIDDENEKEVRHRNRIRARIGLNAKVSDEWDLGFRLATAEGSGGGDPISTNQTLDGSFSKKPFWLDLAYFNYHPSWFKGFSVTAGKIVNPFYTVGKNQLIWDSDLTPEGGALAYTLSFRDKTSVNLAAGGFWVNEESAGVDTSLWGLQLYLKHHIDKPTYILAGASWYDYGNIQGSEGLAAEWKGDPNAFFGNTYTGSPRVFASDYDLLELFAEVGTEIAKLPVAVHGDWVQNTVATEDKNTGWLIGASVNKAKEAGSWQFDYDYREIQADAVVGQFNDSDFVGGGTAGKGHRFTFTYQLTKNVAPAVTYYMVEYWGRAGKVNDDYGRLQADIVVKF